jgi:hypothetical protein
VSRVLASSSDGLAHTMALCGLGGSRSELRGLVMRPT